jgi:hypothetical protein
MDYRLGPCDDRGEWQIIDPARPPGERIIGRLVITLLDTNITGIEAGEEVELSARVQWARDDTTRFDGDDPDDFDWSR